MEEDYCRFARENTPMTVLRDHLCDNKDLRQLLEPQCYCCCSLAVERAEEPLEVEAPVSLLLLSLFRAWVRVSFRLLVDRTVSCIQRLLNIFS